MDRAKNSGRTLHLQMVKWQPGDGEAEPYLSDQHEKRLTWEPREDMGYRIIEENLFKGEVTYREAITPGEAKKLVRKNKASLED